MTDFSCFDKEDDDQNGIHDEIYLNYDCYYVAKNIMIDNGYTSLDNNSSYAVNVLGWHSINGPRSTRSCEKHYFLPKELVYHYVAR